MFYQVIANIDSRFDSLERALAFYNTDTLIIPGIPATHNEREDVTTPRICVAKDVRDCFTSIGLLGRFRRTLAANEDAKSYATVGKECYPVLVLEFSEDVKNHRPYMAQVPDCDVTHEWWILEACKPVRVEVRWLSMFSVMFEERYSIGKHATVFACTDINWVEFTDGLNHPWLNGRGHVLESSEDEGNPEESVI